MDKIYSEVSKMPYVSFKKYGAAVQHYVKSNGDISYYSRIRRQPHSHPSPNNRACHFHGTRLKH